MSKRDYYEILGVAKNSSDDDIKKSYRKLAMKFHPDRVAESDKASSELQFKEVKEAYECLSDAQRRAAYDQHGHSATDPNFNNGGQWTHNVNINDLFGNMFGGGHPFGDIFGQGNGRPQQQRHIVTISLEDAYAGKQIRLPGGHIINVPAGVRTGTRFFADSRIYQIDVQQHHKFKRSDDDLLIDTDVSAFEAILGVEAMLSHLNDVKLQFKIPAGIQNGQIVRLAGKGMPNPEVDRRGDLLVRITVATPRDLSPEQVILIKSLPHRDTFNI